MPHTGRVRRLLVIVATTATIPLAAACSSGPTAPSTGAGTSTSSTSVASSTSSSPSTTSGSVAPADAAYCTVLKSGQQELESMSDKLSDATALERGKLVLQKIEAAAPAEVKAAWGDFIAFVDAAASGDQKALATSTEKMDAAGTKIETHAKKTCGVDIS